MPPTPPPANLTGWQWIAFVAIFVAGTAIQSYFIHRKIDTSKQVDANKSPATDTVKNEEKPS